MAQNIATKIQQLNLKDVKVEQIEASVKLFKPIFIETGNGEKMAVVKDCLTHQIEIIT